MLIIWAVALIFATLVPAGEFRSIESSNGSHVVVRYGATQRVSIDGDSRCTSVRVDRERLLIDSGHRQCSREERPRIEVVTPALSAISVSNGGWVNVEGAFPAQETIDVAVEQGGTIDARSIAADAVEASVYSGGRIFTQARRTLKASVHSGGNITYWGEAEVKRSVRDGGVVTKGSDD